MLIDLAVVKQMIKVLEGVEIVADYKGHFRNREGNFLTRWGPDVTAVTVEGLIKAGITEEYDRFDVVQHTLVMNGIKQAMWHLAGVGFWYGWYEGLNRETALQILEHVHEQGVRIYNAEH